jgi:NhaP-type Na+/H+ or K+/H+ antiporter
MEPISYVSLLLCTLFVAAVSRRIHNTIITVPMLCVVLGLLIGPIGLGFVDIPVGNEAVRIVAEVTLVMVLATDASRIRLRSVRNDHSLPVRLLAIGLPLTMFSGAVAAKVVFPAFPFWEAAILAIILTPTDASLGQAVVSNRLVPARIRQTLNIESGLNDGIAMPFLLLAISLALASEAGPEGLLGWTLWGSQQIFFGALVGLGVGYIGIRFTAWGLRSGWMTGEYSKIAAITLPLVAFGIAEIVHGNGFIAAFLLGATAGNVPVRVNRKPLSEHMAVEVELLMVLTFLIFGAVLLEPALRNLESSVIVYALLSLTVVRMLPVFISMIGAHVRLATTLFMGWFGPRGIASILYIYTVLAAEGIENETLIYTATMVTVFLSIFAHGMTAAPAAKWYGRRMALAGEGDMAEMKDVTEMPLRHPYPVDS